jgi:hypothetical protein
VDEEKEEMSFGDRFFNFLSSNWKTILAFIVIFVFCIGFGILCYIVYSNVMARLDKIENQNQAILATPQQVINPNWLQNTTGMSAQNARDTVTIIERAQEGSIPPQSTIVVQAPTPTEAAVQIKDRINQKDPTLPKEAIKKSDVTIVAEQPKNNEYQVGVYKINNYRKWAVGTGVGTFDNQVYIPVALEYKFDQYQSVEAQMNLDPRNSYDAHRIVNGGQIMYKLHF